jgi:hypothetical protein
VLGLLESSLAHLRPDIAWRCENRLLHFGGRMAEFADRHIEEVKPSAVVLAFVTSPFTWPTAMGRIRRRWPRLYPHARRAADFFKRLSGGGNITSPRGLVFRAPRQLLIWAIGAEPEVEVGLALDSTEATLDSLARYEDTAIVCGLTLFPASRERRREAQQAALQERFSSAVAGACKRHHFGLYDRLREAAGLGHVVDYGRNRDYADLPTRRLDADRMAALIVDGLGLPATDSDLSPVTALVTD